MCLQIFSSKTKNDNLTSIVFQKELIYEHKKCIWLYHGQVLPGSAFCKSSDNEAMKWELMTRNPIEHATIPKEEHKALTADVLLEALEACEDDILSLAIRFVRCESVRSWGSPGIVLIYLR